MRLVLVHARAQATELARYPSFTVPTLVLPVLVFLFFGTQAGAEGARYVAAAFAAFAILGVAFFQFGVGIAQDRTSPWEFYLRTLPISPVARFAARNLAALPFALLAAGAVTAAALLTTPVGIAPSGWARLAAVLLAGSVPFCLFGIALGYWTTPKGAVPLANILYLGLSYAGGLWLPPWQLPEIVARISPFLPTRQWGELLWHAVDGRPWPAAPALGLLAYTAAFGLLAAWGYRRDEGLRFR